MEANVVNFLQCKYSKVSVKSQRPSKGLPPRRGQKRKNAFVTIIKSWKTQTSKKTQPKFKEESTQSDFKAWC